MFSPFYKALSLTQIHSFIQQIFIECLLCAKHVLGAGDIAVNKNLPMSLPHGAFIVVGRDSTKQIICKALEQVLGIRGVGILGGKGRKIL